MVPEWREELGGDARCLDVAGAWREAGEAEEVRENVVAVLGGDALRMELHAMHGMRAFWMKLIGYAPRVFSVMLVSP